MRANRELRIVGIGGGTGLPVLLRSLAGARRVRVTAIVAVSDNGGSSGRLRKSFDMPAVGDLRNCLVALSSNVSHRPGHSVLKNLFQHRFSRGEMEGHSLGNLIVTALFQKTGSLSKALDAVSDLLVLKGRALPSTEAAATLCARFKDGSVIRGELQIAAAGKRIERVWLEPHNPPPSPGVLEALATADAIVLAPGSLYSSLLPNLLVDGVAAAMRRSSAAKILICNLMTQPGETTGFTAPDHVRAIESALGPGSLDFCVVNSAINAVSSPEQCGRYRASGAEPVRPELPQLRAMGLTAMQADLMSVQGGKIRHSPARLGRLILRIARGWARERTASQAA